jgi:hypothetical protein
MYYDTPHVYGQARSPATIQTDSSGCTAGSLEPDLNLIAIRIGHVGVGEARTKLAAPEQSPSRALDFGNGEVDIVRIHEPKTEMRHAANRAGVVGVLRERQDVVPSRRLCVDEAIAASVLAETEDLLIESQCTCSISNRKIDVREAVRLDQRNLSLQPKRPSREDQRRLPSVATTSALNLAPMPRGSDDTPVSSRKRD